MLGCVERNRRTDLVAEFACPHSCRVDDRVCSDRAELRLHTSRATILREDALNLDVFENLHSCRARTLGQRLCDVDRVDDAVVRQVHTADEVVDTCERDEILHVLRSDDVDLESEHARRRRSALQFLESLFVRRDRYRAALLESGRLTRFLFERRKQIRRVLRESGEVVRGAKLADETRGMPGGARRQLLALKEDNIGHPALGEVVSHAATHDPTAHDDDASATWQVGHGFPLPRFGTFSAGI